MNLTQLVTGSPGEIPENARWARKAMLLHGVVFAGLLGFIVFFWPWFENRYYHFLRSGVWPPMAFYRIGKAVRFIQLHFVVLLPAFAFLFWADWQCLRGLARNSRRAQQWNLAVLGILVLLMLTVLYGLASPGIMMLEQRYR